MIAKLDDKGKVEAVRALQRAVSDTLDEPLSDFQAEPLLEAILKAVGPLIYNQAVQDVRAHMQSQLDDLEGVVRFDD